MINKELLKEIIVSNEEFILNQVKGIIKREGIISQISPILLMSLRIKDSISIK